MMLIQLNIQRVPKKKKSTYNVKNNYIFFLFFVKRWEPYVSACRGGFTTQLA